MTRLRRLAAFAAAGGIAIAGLAFAAHRAESRVRLEEPTPIAVRASALEGFEITDLERRRFGRLTFLGGLVLSSQFDAFGGLSGLEMTRDGSGLTAVSDAGYWLTANIRYAGRQPAALEDVVMAPLLDEQGTPLATKRLSDAESLALLPDGGTIVGLERDHALLLYADRAASGRRLEIPGEIEALPINSGIEAVAVCETGPLAGRILAFAEATRDGAAPFWLMAMDGALQDDGSVPVPDGFSITGAACLPDGDVLVVERRLSSIFDLGMRLRLFSAEALAAARPGQGEVLLRADLGHEIDNMEGVGVHVGENGRPVVTLLSDDNYFFLQRTLLLQFELGD